MALDHIIELNGEFYDANSGRKISSTDSAAEPASTDGFSRPKHHAPRKVSGHRTKHVVKKSTTLKRQFVKKPLLKSAKQAKQTAKDDQPPKPSKLSVPEARLKRLNEIQKSQLVRKFSDTTYSRPANLQTDQINEDAHNEVAPSTHLHKALEQAASHNEPRFKKPSRRQKLASKLNISPKTLSIGAAVLAVLVLGSFYALMNVPNLAMKVASTRSHVDGSLPRQLPSGFSLSGSIKYQPGEIRLSYKSNSDNRNFVITQRTSSWNSATLKQNYLATKTAQTYQEKGKTIYVYDGSSATWVDSGVWYTVEGDSRLSTDQLLKLAASL